jgi:hypothetical protein
MQEPLTEVNHAANPENLARNEDQEQGQEEAQLVRMYDVEGSRSKDQYQNNRAPMGDDALAKVRATHHPRHPLGEILYHRPGNWALEPTQGAPIARAGSRNVLARANRRTKRI